MTGRLVRAALVVASLVPPAALPADSQSVEVRIDVPGIGQERATGLYDFKFAIIDTASGDTLWSNDGSSHRGEEPRASVPFFVDSGTVVVTLGDPPQASLPPLPGELLDRDDVVLRVWTGNAASPTFRRLPDRRLRGKGFAYRAETARNADRLEGRRAQDFEAAGTVARHEEAFAHVPSGKFAGGRHWHGSLDLAGNRSVAVHFDVPDEEPTIVLKLWGSPLVGPPSLTDLEMRSARMDHQTVGTTVDVVDHRGAGWLAGVRESWDYCHNCFRRKLPPETEIYLDGTPWEPWRSARRDPPESAQPGRLENLAPFGLVRFERSLRVTSRHRGADDSTGSTAVWWYVVAGPPGGAPGAIQVLLDGGDITSALVGLPESAPAARSLAGRLVAARFDGFALLADALDPAPLLTRPAASTWLTSGAALAGRAAASGSALLAIGEVRLAAGERRFTLQGRAPAALELLVDGVYRRAAALATPGAAEAALAIPTDGWYQLRLVSSAGDGDLTASFLVDGRTPIVRTAPLLGGEGGQPWAAGPLDFATAGIPVGPGEHVLVLRERGGRSGHLEYSLLVE